MSEAIKLRRFWDHVHLQEHENGFQILLDTRPVKLPQKTVLHIKNKVLAQKIVKEWEQAGSKKGDVFSFEQLPLTRMVGTMIEKIIPNRNMYVDVLIPYLNGDLLCYHADTPKQLVNKQQEYWLPLVHWFQERFSVQLITKTGIMPITQSPITVQTVQNYLSNLTDGELTAFAVLVPLLGSIILTCAMKENQINAKYAFELAYLDETVQAEIWGYDSQQQGRLDKICKDIEEASEFLELISNS
ncbi:ATP12 family chaperone protein [Commensalibacter oyaizuii]|uniref:ATP12 family protein n=1 Tax=Commensalibacter oyaizuii TaxID=3043873 RepID=A0ABT6PZN2_9PROT|nr:ATP12 family protein [Commensalibacter sp. TBRC 16381]MDI2090279.1 ATP12 family protein [Commensalibacter sp. TBRC 16381]